MAGVVRMGDGKTVPKPNTNPIPNQSQYQPNTQQRHRGAHPPIPTQYPNIAQRAISQQRRRGAHPPIANICTNDSLDYGIFYTNLRHVGSDIVSGTECRLYSNYAQ